MSLAGLIENPNPGDKSFMNGVEEVYSDPKMRAQMESMVERILAQKQQELATGNPAQLLSTISQDSPDAAIYRALLLQQMEDKKKKEEPSWASKAFWGTAKFLGTMALRYIAFQTLFKGYDIITKGPSAAWNKWLAENGVAKAPDLAEKSGDVTAAVGNDILKRTTNFNDLSPAQQKMFLQYSKDNGFFDKTNTMESTFSLKSMFEKDGEYFDSIPTGADPKDYTKTWSMMWNTGSKDGPSIPISAETVGKNLFDSSFKMGNVKTLITEDDNWFTGNTFVRGFDNGLTHIADITGRNELKRKAYWDSEEWYKSGAKKMALTPSGDGAGVPEEIVKTVADSNTLSDQDILDKRVTDAVNLAKANIDNVLANTEFTGWTTLAKFDINPDKLDSVLDKVLGMSKNRMGASTVFDALNPNTTVGVTEEGLLDFIERAVKAKLSSASYKEKLGIYEALVREYQKKSFGSFHGKPYLKAEYDPNAYKHMDFARINNVLAAGFTSGMGLTTAIGLASAGVLSAPFSIGLGIASLAAGLMINTLKK